MRFAERFGFQSRAKVPGRAVLATVLALGLAALAFTSGCSGADTGSSETVETGSSITSVSETTSTSTPANTATTKFTVGGEDTSTYEEKLPALLEKAKANPTDLEILQDLAVAQFQTDRFADAAATYEQMLKLKDDAVYHNNYGNVLREWGKPAEAKMQYEKALALDPALTVAYVNLVRVLLAEGDKDGAIALLDKGIANTTGDDQTRLKNIKAQMTEK